VYQVAGDEQLIRQALTNLIKNAIEAVEGRASQKVAVVLSQGTKGVWLSVLDNGPGIDAVHQDSVLEPYVTTKPKGTGLGLAIVKKVMEDHNGKITMNDPVIFENDLLSTFTGAHIHLYFPFQQGATVA
jgi:two-component system, NtrC family, nitrogen regulation sensor histidine kinase NtrY